MLKISKLTMVILRYKLKKDNKKKLIGSKVLKSVKEDQNTLFHFNKDI